MKTEQQTKIAEREDQLRNEFLKNLDAVNEAFATRQKNLLESHNLLTEFASEMQVELENVANENNRQSEYLQAHHNDYVRYSKEIFLRLKQERDEINEQLSETELKYKKELQRLETKFMEVAQKSELEMDNFNRFKQDKLVNLESQQRNLREARNEIHAKDAIIEDMSKDKDGMRSSLKN